MRARLTALALATLSVGLALSCSAMIEAELTRVNCSWEGAIGPPACPGGQMCRSGVCAPCASTDICGDGQDNDCDGLVDDGCDDAGVGGDGATGGSGGSAASGGTSGGAGGVAGSVATGGGGGLSGTGGVAGAAGSGGGGTGGAGGTGGSGGSVAGELGSPCAATSNCNTGLFCENPAVFGAATGPTVCMSGCCKSEDCGNEANVCFPAVGGGSACVPAASVGRGPLGTKAAGAACGANSECRSGLCDAKQCFDTCCGDSGCSGSQYCVRRTLPGTSRLVMACGTNIGNGGFLAFCSSGSSACQSGLCLNTIPAVCSKTCCTSKDCAGSVSLACVQNSGIRFCGNYSGGTKLLGATCTDSTECKSGHCLGPTGGPYYCSDTCCSDFDCGAGFGCRPATLGSTNYLLCLKL
ncbi:MAG: hypothetical protein IPI67_19095 [Myxococcales bacterium]|nr:hypothetical protein [Myxococcales bacterium]